MQINTRKLPATDTEGVRIRAEVVGGRVVIRPYPFQAEEPHLKIAEELAREQAGSRFVSIEQNGETRNGYKFIVTTKPDSAPTED